VQAGERCRFELRDGSQWHHLALGSLLAFSPLQLILQQAMANLLNLTHEARKAGFIRLLKSRVGNGGRGSIKRSVLQKELTRELQLDAALGNPRKSVEAALGRAIAALRQERPPRLQKDKSDDLIRLTK